MTTKEKLKHLLDRDFPVKEKLAVSAALGFTLSFNFLFFGMMYIYLSNHIDFMIPAGKVFQAALITSLPAWIVISALLFALPGRIYTIAASFAAGLIIAGYLQGNFFNSTVELGQMTGDAIYWRIYTNRTLINTVVWLILLLVPVALRILTNAKTWKTAVLIACLLVTGMQATALVAAFFAQDSDEIKYESIYYLSREGAYEVSSKNNVFVFVIDRLDQAYVDEVRDGSPGFFDPLDGFTEFTNAAANYEATFPSGTFMTTGVPYDYEMTRAEYFDYAWNSSEFIRTMKDAGYTTRYHMTAGYMYSDFEQILNVADNVEDGRPEYTMRSKIVNFVTLSAYRFAPLALKPSFWLHTIKFDTTGDITENHFVDHNDPLFMRLLNEYGLSLQNKTNNYYYLHLYGVHAPYTMDENGNFAGATDQVAQTKGCFNILYKYMDEMKELGVYEDSTIIILGDHGWGSFHIGFFVKPAGSAGMPLAQSNAPVSISDNFLATILSSEGLDYNGFGVPALDVEPDTPGERYVARYSQTIDKVEFFKVIGHIRDENNWEIIDSRTFYVDYEVGLPID